MPENGGTKPASSMASDGVAASALAQTVELVDSIRSRLAQIHRIEDRRASAIATECEEVLAEIAEDLAAARSGRSLP